MSESSPPFVTGSLGRGHEEGLTPQSVAAIVGEFRSWLVDTILLAPERLEPNTNGQADSSEPIDLQTLLGQMIALKQEVNLQTRAVRNQQEQNTETLKQLGGALHSLRQAHSTLSQTQTQEQNEAVRPLLKTLVELHDAFARADREIQKVIDGVLPELDRMASVAPPPPCAVMAEPPKRSFWSRLFGGTAQPISQNTPNVAPAVSREDIGPQLEKIKDVLESLLTGYSMSLQRLERTLEQHDMEAIPCVGEQFDPELMEAIDVITDPSRNPNEVVEEVRRGYLWHDRIFRCALVKVVKS